MGSSLFHLMRVLEHGLHHLAAEVEVSVSPEFENWKDIIDQIEKRIRGMEQLTKSPEKSGTIEFHAQLPAISANSRTPGETMSHMRIEPMTKELP